MQQWVIPPQASSTFVAAMEDVLAFYKRPRDGDGPLVCLDETSKQLLAGTRAPIPMKPGQPAPIFSLVGILLATSQVEALISMAK